MTFIAKDSYDKQELLDCGEGELFGDGNGRLPTPNMLMFDRINHISGACHIKIFISMVWGNFTKVVCKCKKTEKSESAQLQVFFTARIVEQKSCLHH